MPTKKNMDSFHFWDLVVVGRGLVGGIESKFSVHLRPKLNDLFTFCAFMAAALFIHNF